LGTTPPGGAANYFADVLAKISRGAVLDEATLSLGALVQAVTSTGRKGSLTVTLSVAPMKGSPGQVTVSAAVGVKEPKDDAHAGVFFTDDTGRLSRNDPYQATLDETEDAK